jgi:hypothetical protein
MGRISFTWNEVLVYILLGLGLAEAFFDPLVDTV